MNSPAEGRPTFRLRLEEMRQDLVVIAHELNKSEYWDAAMRAQQVLLAVDHLFGADIDLDDPDDWRWPPFPMEQA